MSTLGYPGFANAEILIKSALNPVTILSGQDGARVHYRLDDPGGDDATLPDQYNGLGFKNLIYMVVELLDLHAAWVATDDERPPLHLIFIEEPEAHLHAQLQQVFIRKVFDILRFEGEDEQFASQLVVTTHSAHILYENGFKHVRYFRRGNIAELRHTSEVLNLSTFYDSAPTTRDFLERYVKLTHCDLFFADAAVLVEGNVERLLMPAMITKVAPALESSYISVLEIGGAFGYQFKSLIDFLGITTLIITDIDSIVPRTPAADGAPQVADDDEDPPASANRNGRACPVGTTGAVTSNQTLIQWLPKKTLIVDLLAATPAERSEAAGAARVRVAYQTLRSVTWKENTQELCGRTLEEAFALENLNWCQHSDRKGLGLRIPRSETLSLSDLANRIYERVKGAGFHKTDFALGLLAENPSAWVVPHYIAEGLGWLAEEVRPVAATAPTPTASESGVPAATEVSV